MKQFAQGHNCSKSQRAHSRRRLTLPVAQSLLHPPRVPPTQYPSSAFLLRALARLAVMLRGGAGQTHYFCNRSPVCVYEKQYWTQARSATADKRSDSSGRAGGAGSAQGLRGRARESDVGADQSSNNDSPAVGPALRPPRLSSGRGLSHRAAQPGQGRAGRQPPVQEPLSAPPRAQARRAKSTGRRRSRSRNGGHSGRGSTLS